MGRSTAVSRGARALASAGDGALGGVGHGDGVLVKYTARIARLGRLPLGETLLHLRPRDLDIDPPLLHVDVNHVAALHGGDGSALRRLGHDVRHHETVARPGEAPVGHEGYGIAQARALERAGDVEHLAHARPALRSLVADDDDVVGLDLAFLDGLESAFLALEHARGAAMLGLALAGELDHAAAGGEVAAQDDDAARGFEGLLERLDYLLARRLGGGGDLLADGTSRHRLLARMDQPRLHQALAHHGHAARLVHLGRRVGAPRLQVGDHGCLLRQAVEIIDGELEPEILRGGRQVQHGVRRAARGKDAGDRVLEAPARHQRARRNALPHELHDELAALERDLLLAGIGGGNAVPAHGRHAQHLVGGGHGVGGELAAAGARPWARVVLDVLELLEGDLAGVVGAESLEHVLDGQVAIGEGALGARAAPEHDGAAVQHEAGDVETPQHHGHGRDGLVAPGDGDEAVEHVAARHQLHRVRHYLAADERALHPFRAHGDAIGDGDRVDLDGSAPGGSDALHHILGELPVVPVAGHGPDPAVGDTDLRAGEVLVGEADGLHHGAGGRAVGTLEENAALVAGIGGHDWAPLS